MPNNKVYRTGMGYATATARQDYLSFHGLDGDEVTTDLAASKDGPLYPWQLHSLLGPERIEGLITSFYTRVYADKGEYKWFKDAFERISPVEHHIMTQTQFWIDTMGGGRAYHGGDYRLNFHHEHNAHQVMNADGAKRWMHHMRLAIAEQDYRKLDKRIKPAILDFLRVKMSKYAGQHGWEFTAEDFAPLEGPEELGSEGDGSAGEAGASGGEGRLNPAAKCTPPPRAEGSRGAERCCGLFGGRQHVSAEDP